MSKRSDQALRVLRILVRRRELGTAYLIDVAHDRVALLVPSRRNQRLTRQSDFPASVVTEICKGSPRITLAGTVPTPAYVGAHSGDDPEHVARVIKRIAKPRNRAGQ